MTAVTGTFVMAWHIPEEDMDVLQRDLITRHTTHAARAILDGHIQILAPLTWTIHQTTTDTTITHDGYTEHYPAGLQHVCHAPATIRDDTTEQAGATPW